MALAYLAATVVQESPADKATLTTFVPANKRELAYGLVAGLYASWRWRSTFAAIAVGLLGAKAPILTGVGLVAHGVFKARSER